MLSTLPRTSAAREAKLAKAKPTGGNVLLASGTEPPLDQRPILFMEYRQDWRSGYWQKGVRDELFARTIAAV